MKAALEQFHNNIGRADHLSGLYKALQNQTTIALDNSDILRAAVVTVVSALDQFIHEITRIGMLDAHRGLLQKSDAFRRFSVSMAAVEKHSTDPAVSDWLDEEIRARHSWLSFEHPDRIAEALHLVSGSNVWEAVSPGLGLSPHDVKARLTLIVDRRNKIAHESDLNPSLPGERWPIDEQLVDDTTYFIHKVGESVYDWVIGHYVNS